MSLSAKYQAFLANPSSSALAENASLHYVTTLTTINNATAIIKHLSVQEKLLKKKGEKVLSAIEGANALSLDVETTLEFITGGGAYLPGLDDNFVADRTVTFPTIHMVHFEGDKISQIRINWDQGSLLKQIDVIGARARNWPIRDGKDQARLIKQSASSVVPAGSAASQPSTRRSTTSQDEVTITSRPTSSRSSASNAMNDPHATLSLFQPRDTNQESSLPSRQNAPRMQSAKPPPREYSELFVGEGGASPSPSIAGSPSKDRIPVKSGAGKNYKPSRLFDEEEEVAPTPMSVKTHSKKYNHFDLGDDNATPQARETGRPASKSQHQASWGFEDFVTPAKAKPKILGQSVRHFGWSDDEDEGSPVRRPVVHKARPDADPHFEFVDDGTPQADKKAVPPMGRNQNKGLGLYSDHVVGTNSDDEESTPHGDVKRPVAVVKNENRKKDFGSQWEMNDDSPAASKNASHVSKGNPKVSKNLDTNWEMYEQSPDQVKKENVKTRGINIAGNGMGGRKGYEWDLYNQYDQESDHETKENLKSRRINIAGNGMGGLKGTEFSIADQGQKEELQPKKKGDKNFWDF